MKYSQLDFYTLEEFCSSTLLLFFSLYQGLAIDVLLYFKLPHVGAHLITKPDAIVTSFFTTTIPPEITY